MKQSLRSVLLALMIGMVAMSVGAESRRYPEFKANVSFEFSLGKRIFPAGNYSFIVLGPGLLAVRDPQGRIPAIFMTRPVRSPEGTPPVQLVFRKRKQHFRLEEIWLG